MKQHAGRSIGLWLTRRSRGLRNRSARHILRHEVNGLLVPQDDHDALVSALEQLMADDSLRSHLGENAVEARWRFAVSKVASMWETLFYEVVK